jgi:hypothetical protein
MFSFLLVCGLWFRERGLGEKRTPKKDSTPKVQRSNAECFRKGEGEVGEGEGVEHNQGEESEG